MNSGNNRPNSSDEAYTNPLNNTASSGNKTPVGNEASGTVVFNTVNNELIRHPQSGSAAFNSTYEASNKSKDNRDNSTPEDNARIYQNPTIRKQLDPLATSTTQASNSAVASSDIKTVNNKSYNTLPHDHTTVNAHNNAKTVPINPDSNRAGNTNTAGVMPQAHNAQEVPNAARVMPKGSNNNVSAHGAPNNARVNPQVPNRNTGVQGNPNATRVIPQVPNRNIGTQGNPNATRIIPQVPNRNMGTQGNQNATRVMPQVPNQNAGSKGNPNATRIIPRVPNQNSGAKINPNATRIMPRVTNQNSNSQGNNYSYGGVSYGNSSQSSTTPSGAVTNPAGGYHQNNGTNGISNRSNMKGMSSANPATKQNGTGSTKSTVHGSASKKKKRTKKRFGFLIGSFKFILYIAFVIFASIVLSKYIIGAGNDVFAFVKDSYNYTDTVYSTKGEASNSFRITDTFLSGDKFEFEYSFETPLTDEEKHALDATIIVVDTKNNYVIHNFGKYTQDIIDKKKITLDLSNADMEDSEYIIRLTVGTGNSVFYITEFTFSRKLVDITLEDNASTSDVAKVLKENGIIDHPTAFKLYAKLKKGEKKSLGTTYVAGDHTLYAGMDYDEILYALSPKNYVRDIVKLTFPEGCTVDEMIDILIKGGVRNSKADYIKVMENYEQFDYRFIDMLKEQGVDDSRVYSLEGYLFPDTYEFYTDSSPEAVIDKFLSNFDAKFDNSFYDEATKLGLTVDEVVRIASLVESEAGNPDDKGNIASVFHNRLNNPSVYPKLESDATTDYASYNLKSALKLTEYKCSKCGKKDTKHVSKCSECGNSNSYIKYKCATFSVKLANYSLIDADYYINFTISTDTTRAKASVFLNKKTTEEKTVYSVTGKTVTSNPEYGNMGMTIKEAKVDANGVLTCEVMLDHDFNSDEFMKFPMRLNLFRSDYDTYSVNGLMPGAVSNPGYESIIAALYPNSTNYYFFVADSSGNSHFASTLDQHNKNISDLVRDGKAVSTD